MTLFNVKGSGKLHLKSTDTGTEIDELTVQIGVERAEVITFHSFKNFYFLIIQMPLQCTFMTKQNGLIIGSNDRFDS